MLTFQSNIQRASEALKIVSGIAVSPNNRRIAIANSDKVIALLDENYERRDKIPTRGADKDNRNYVVRAVEFSPDSTVLAVVQSDNIIYSYKIGGDWGEKKSICSKIVTNSTPTCIVWPRNSHFEFYFGQADGSVRIGFIKTHKSQAVYATDSYVVSIAADRAGKNVISGHLDGQVYIYNVETQSYRKFVNLGTVPYCLGFGRHVVVGGANNVVAFVDKAGNTVQRFDFADRQGLRGFNGAYFNPSGDGVVIAGFSCLIVFNWNAKRNEWEENGSLTPQNYYNVTSACWRPDGSKFLTANVCGSVDLFDVSIKRTNFKGRFELNYLSPSKLQITSIERRTSATIASQKGFEILNVDIMKDRFVVATTPNTLVLGDLSKNKSSEVDWSGSGNEKFEFTDSDLLWVANAGEVSVIELGKDEVLTSFRTEHTNRRLLSLISKGSAENRRQLVAYLLDSQTIRVLNVVTRVSECTVDHDAKITWLQFNPNANKLLFKDAKRALYLYCLSTREKSNLLPGCGFCSWVPESDVIIAQSKGQLNIWYSSDAPDKRVSQPIRGTVVEIKTHPKLCVVALDGNIENTVELDDVLMKFGYAVENKSIPACLAILEGKRGADSEGHWRALLKLAEEARNYLVVERCLVALGDITRADFYHRLNKAVKALKKEGKSDAEVEQSVEVRTMRAMIEGNFEAAEKAFLEAGQPERAIDMYQALHKWDDSLRIAQKSQPEQYKGLRESYFEWLLQTGQQERAAELCESDGAVVRAIDLYLEAGLPARAAAIIVRCNMRSVEDQIRRVFKALNDGEMHENLAELYEFFEDYPKAVGMYIKAAVFSKALELARRHMPEQVVLIEEKWGNYLMEQNQKESAVNHFIEAQCSKKALEAAVACRHWQKAISLLGSLSAEDQRTYAGLIAEQLAAGKQFDLAEKYFAKAGKKEAAFKMHVDAKRLKEALVFGRENFTAEELEAICERVGRELEKTGSLEAAERLYVETRKPESAIRMYKALGQYDKMLRLFAVHRPESLKEAHSWVGKRLEEEDQLAQAERHYLEAGSWTAAVDMYERRRMLEDCLRICKNFASDRDTVERAKRWDQLVSEAELVELLKRAGLIGSLIDYFCERRKFDEAFKAADKARHKLPDVHLSYAMHLEDERQYKEAEREYVLAGKYDQVVHMYLDIEDFVSAVQVARQYDHKLLEEVYLRQAKVALEHGDLEKMELCFVSARRPELAVSTYSKLGHLSEAVRVARKHCPAMVKELSQSAQAGDVAAAPTNPAELEKQLRVWEEAREWEKVIDVCLEVSETMFPQVADLEAIWDKAVQVAFNYVPNRYLETVQIVCKRLRSLGRFTTAGDYYESVQKHEEAVKCFLTAGEVDKARVSCGKVADLSRQNELKEAIDKAFKAQLRSKKDAEQLVGNEEVREGLDLMAERGDWLQALTIAASKEPVLFEAYLQRFLRDSLEAGRFAESLKTLLKFGTPATPQMIEIYRRLVDETFALCDPGEISDLKLVLFGLLQPPSVDRLSAAEKAEFNTYLLVAHLTQLKQLYDSHKLKSLSADTAVSLCRYVHLSTIDKPFFDAGEALKAVGQEVEAFMYLNRYLDVYELIRDQPNGTIEESDEFKKTDIPDLKTLRIPANNLLSEVEKDKLKDWLLSVSLKTQALRLPERECNICHQKMYAKALKCHSCQKASEPCFLTGLPIAPNEEKGCGGCGKRFREDAYRAYVSYFSHCPWCNKALIK